MYPLPCKIFVTLQCHNFAYLRQVAAVKLGKFIDFTVLSPAVSMNIRLVPLDIKRLEAQAVLWHQTCLLYSELRSEHSANTDHPQSPRILQGAQKSTGI